MKKTVRSTWNFGRKQATPAQGSAGEAQLNMDVNWRRLPEHTIAMSKFLVPLAGIMLHL